MQENEKIKRHIIHILYSKGAYRKGHMLQERLTSGIPGHLKGNAKKVLNDLVKENMVLVYAVTQHGTAYQLNIKKLHEIEKILNSEI